MIIKQDKINEIINNCDFDFQESDSYELILHKKIALVQLTGVLIEDKWINDNPQVISFIKSHLGKENIVIKSKINWGLLSHMPDNLEEKRKEDLLGWSYQIMSLSEDSLVDYFSKYREILINDESQINVVAGQEIDMFFLFLIKDDKICEKLFEKSVLSDLLKIRYLSNLNISKSDISWKLSLLSKKNIKKFVDVDGNLNSDIYDLDEVYKGWLKFIKIYIQKFQEKYLNSKENIISFLREFNDGGKNLDIKKSILYYDLIPEKFKNEKEVVKMIAQIKRYDLVKGERFINKNINEKMFLMLLEDSADLINARVLDDIYRLSEVDQGILEGLGLKYLDKIKNLLLGDKKIKEEVCKIIPKKWIESKDFKEFVVTNGIEITTAHEMKGVVSFLSTKEGMDLALKNEHYQAFGFMNNEKIEKLNLDNKILNKVLPFNIDILNKKKKSQIMEIIKEDISVLEKISQKWERYQVADFFKSFSKKNWSDLCGSNDNVVKSFLINYGLEKIDTTKLPEEWFKEEGFLKAIIKSRSLDGMKNLSFNEKYLALGFKRNGCWIIDPKLFLNEDFQIELIKEIKSDVLIPPFLWSSQTFIGKVCELLDGQDLKLSWFNKNSFNEDVLLFFEKSIALKSTFLESFNSFINFTNISKKIENYNFDTNNTRRKI